MIRALVQDYGWIHRGLGLVGNLTFVIGSVLFLPSYSAWQVVAVWLFITGSALMFVGAAGEFAVRLYENGRHTGKGTRGRNASDD
ncbi:YrhK family protein [Novosphingobium sp. ZN18A2]|uniref:YrhK family protein n=1 Tax=Novosphingobium sp. ZN18A2 TaxID=3079861 RepID=UPI0030CF9682